MSDTDPTSGFITRNSQTAEQWEAAQAERRAAALADQPAPEQQWGTVGQGTAGRQPVDSTFSAANLSDHQFFLAHRAEILEAAKRGELEGQPGYTSTPTN